MMEDQTNKTEKKMEEEKPVQTPVSGLIEKANIAAERLEKANAEYKTLLEKEEKIRAIAMFSGNADAGQFIKSPEDTEKEKSQKLADEITNAFR